MIDLELIGLIDCSRLKLKQKTEMWYKNLKLTFCILLIYIIFVLISIINNKLFKTPYRHRHQEAQHYFVYPDLLQVLASGSSFAAGYFYSRIVRKQSKSPLPIPQKALLGVLYTLRVSCPNYALYFIPFTTRIIWDSLGYFSTVFFSVFLTRYSWKDNKKLPFSKLKTAIVISLGGLFFTYNYSSNFDGASSEQMQMGYLLVAVALISKGLFIDNQSYCKNHYDATVYQLLYEVNLYSCLISLVFLTAKGDLFESVRFVEDHFIYIDLGLYSLLSAAGQFLIYNSVFNFELKQNITPLLATTRKIVIIVVSILMREEEVTLEMLIGLVVLFGGMIYEVVDSTYYTFTRTQPIKVYKIEQQVQEETEKSA